MFSNHLAVLDGATINAYISYFWLIFQYNSTYDRLSSSTKTAFAYVSDLISQYTIRDYYSIACHRTRSRAPRLPG